MISRTAAAALLALSALGAVPATAAAAAPGTPAVSAAPVGGPGQWIVQSSSGSAAAAAAVVRAGGRVVATLDLIGAVAADLPAGAATSLGDGITLLPDPSLRVASTDDPAAQVAAMDPGTLASPTAGAGVGIALVDTGVDPLPPLAGHLVAGPDFSGEGTPIDTYGHGTFMAGLIAGAGTGSAPGATVVSVKVAGADGSTDATKVISAIGWVVANHERFGIDVLSLSLSAITGLVPAEDPIDLAVEAASNRGITVVAAAGNTAGAVSAPGDDPMALTAGAEGGVTPGPAAAWSGSSASKPDVLAPGTSVLSLRAPGSTIDVANPSARVGDHLFRGSGTSMATALLAGGVADLLSAHPGADPAAVRAAVVASSGGTAGPGAAPVDLAAADAALAAAPASDHGLGHANRGDHQFVLTAGSWDPADWAAMRWAGADWAAMRWASADWAAMRWAAGDWDAMRWAGADWAAMRWSDSRWSAMRWSAMRWSAMRWSAMRWSAMRWSSMPWSDVAWG